MHRIDWRMPTRRFVSLLAIFLAAASTQTWAKEISWRATTKITASEGNRFTREGTAVFSDGTEAHVVINGVSGTGNSWSKGTSKADALYRFKDGSAFTLRFEVSWNAVQQRGAGTFADGTGRFAGITGNATAIGEMPTTGLTAVDWTGSYELSPQ
jgi:hypothetical protein